MGNTPSAVPYGAQLTNISTTLTCSALGSYGDYAFSISATAPLFGNGNQQIYYSDIVIEMDLNGVFQSSFGVEAPGNYTISANVGIDLTQAKGQSSINLTATTTADDRQSHVRFPNGGGVLPRLGPVTLATPMQVHTFSLGKVDFNVSLNNLNIAVDCVKQSPKIIIGSTVIKRGDGGVPLSPANGFPGVLPAIRSGEKATVANYPVTCRGDNFVQSNPFNITLGGVVPNIVKRGTTWNVTDIVSFLIVPRNNVEAFEAGISGDPKKFSVTLNGTTGFGLQTGGSPATIDLARNFTSTNGYKPPLSGSTLLYGNPGRDVAIALPSVGSLSIGPFGLSTGGIGTNVLVVAGFFEVQGSGQGLVDYSTNFNCTPVYSSQIWTANVGQ